MKKAAIIVPTFNEVESITHLVEKTISVSQTIKNWEIEILIVDSTSPDKTASAVRQLQQKFSNLHLITTKREGLGRAYLRGFTFALRNLKADVVFEMDADLSHDPQVIPQFLT